MNGINTNTKSHVCASIWYLYCIIVVISISADLRIVILQQCHDNNKSRYLPYMSWRNHKAMRSTDRTYCHPNHQSVLEKNWTNHLIIKYTSIGYTKTAKSWHWIEFQPLWLNDPAPIAIPVFVSARCVSCHTCFAIRKGQSVYQKTTFTDNILRHDHLLKAISTFFAIQYISKQRHTVVCF